MNGWWMVEEWLRNGWRTVEERLRKGWGWSIRLQWMGMGAEWLQSGFEKHPSVTGSCRNLSLSIPQAFCTCHEHSCTILHMPQASPKCSAHAARFGTAWNTWGMLTASSKRYSREYFYQSSAPPCRMDVEWLGTPHSAPIQHPFCTCSTPIPQRFPEVWDWPIKA